MSDNSTIGQKRKKEKADDLPIGWTTISRIRKEKKSSDVLANEYCCEDPTCKNSYTPTISPEIESNQLPAELMSLSGLAFFCIHSLSTKWFQGRFVPTHGKPISLLVQQRNDLDDCLQCADNGYREIDLSIFSRFCDTEGTRQNICLEKLKCTGGDMLRVVDVESNLLFDAERIVTGITTISIVEKYFKNIIPSMEENQTLLDVLPDVAIVIGEMKLRLKKDFVDRIYDIKKKESIVTDDGWLSD